MIGIALLKVQKGPSPLSDVLHALEGTLHWLLDLPPAVTRFARQSDNLQYLEFVILWGIGIITLGAALWFVIRYRRRGPNEFPRTPKVTFPAWFELSLGAGILGLFMFFWVLGFNQYVQAANPPRDATDVYVTGKQWVWKFAYAQGPTTAGILYVPVGRPVRVRITSRDVIHSFYVPDFRLKRDAVPGRYTTTWFEADTTGHFQILCAEYCGAGHSRMWGEVVALPPDRFDAWLSGQTPAEESPDTTTPITSPLGLSPERLSMIERGFNFAAQYGCLRCHTTDGSPGTGPTWKGLYLSWVALQSGDSVIADDGYLTKSMMQPAADLVAGFQNLMPSFQGYLQPGEIAAIVEYIRSIAGPSDSFELRGSGQNPNGPDSTAPGVRMEALQQQRARTAPQDTTGGGR